MYFKSLILCAYLVHLCGSDEILLSLLSRLLLSRNIKFVTFIFDNTAEVQGLFNKEYVRANYRQFYNQSQVFSTTELNKFAYVILLNNVAQAELLSVLSRLKPTSIIITKDLNQTLMYCYEYTNLRWDSDIVILEQKKSFNSNLYEMWKVYGSEKVKTYPKLTYIGAWPLINVESNNLNFYSDRRSLEGIKLKISTEFPDSLPQLYFKSCDFVWDWNHVGTLDDQYVYLRTEKEICCIVINLLQYIHNFSIEILEATNSSERRKEVDITSGFMNITTVDALDCIGDVYPFRKAFILKNPLGGNKNIFIKPFSSRLWSAFILLLLIMAIVLKILLSILKSLGMVDDKSWTSVILNLLYIVSLKGSPVEYNFLSFRMYLLTSFLTSVLLYNYYSSIIVSLLLANPDPNVKSVRDLQKTNIKLGIEDMADYYEVPNNTFTVNDTSNIMYNLSEAVVKIKRGQFAYYTEPATRYKFLEKHLSFLEICSLIEIDAVATAYTRMMVPKGAEFKELFRVSFRHIIEKGFLKRELQKLLRKKPLCLAHVDFAEFTLNDLSFAFILFYCGVILSAIIFCLEHLHYRFLYVHDKKTR